MDHSISVQRYGLLRGMGEHLLSLVCESAPSEQLRAWLRVPLEHAAARGDFTCVEKLLAAGANPSLVRRSAAHGRSPLIAAARGGNEGVVAALLESGAKPDGESWEFPDNEYCTGGSLSGGDSGGGSRAQQLAGSSYVASVSAMSLCGEEDGNLWSPLHCAASGGHVAAVKALVRGGADLDAADSEGEK